MSIEFFQTGMGHKFYESDVPRIGKALERIASALEILAAEGRFLKALEDAKKKEDI